MAKSSTSGQGRPKGIPNKMTKDLREMILGALDDAGGKEYLVRQAEETPGPFLTLVGKCLPREIKGDLNMTIAPAEELARLKAIAEQARKK